MIFQGSNRRTMPEIPDLTDPRYLDEVGWFLYHEACGRDGFTGSYTEERLAYSGMFLREVLDFCGENPSWLHDKTVVTFGCGCTGDLNAWPAAIKIAVDPLLYTYQQLGMIADDLPGTASTLCLSVGVENLRSEEHTSELQSLTNLVCRLLLEKKQYHRWDSHRLGMQLGVAVIGHCVPALLGFATSAGVELELEVASIVGGRAHFIDDRRIKV